MRAEMSYFTSVARPYSSHQNQFVEEFHCAFHNSVTLVHSNHMDLLEIGSGKLRLTHLCCHHVPMLLVDQILRPTEDDLKSWPHNFEYRLRVGLGTEGELTLMSRIRNTNSDGKPFTFTFAYHTNSDGKPSLFPVPVHVSVQHSFSVSYISEVRVEGLETLDYLDNLKNREHFTERGDAITFESVIDRIYLSTPTKIAILDHEKKRTFVVRKDGLADAVMWNPWDKKSKTISDLGDEDYKHMLCVEAAAIERPITLKPGEEGKGRLELSAVPSSYSSGQLDPKKVLQ